MAEDPPAFEVIYLHKYVQIFNYFISQDSKNVGLSHRNTTVDDFGETPLRYVSEGKYDSEEAGVGVARLLLEHGGDVNGQSEQQWMPLHVASFNGKLEIAQLLLDHGAKVDAVDNFGKTT